MSPPNRKRKNRIRIAPAPAASQHHSLPSNADGEQATPSSSIEEKSDRMHQKQARTDKPNTIPQSRPMNDSMDHKTTAHKAENVSSAKPEALVGEPPVVSANELKYLATKEDVGRIEGLIAGKAEKCDVERVEGTVKEEVARLEGILNSKADKTDLVRLETKLDNLCEHVDKNMATKEFVQSFVTKATFWVSAG